jgi:hypothetical protein
MVGEKIMMVVKKHVLPHVNKKSWCHKLTHCDTWYYCNKPHRNYQAEKSPLEEMRCSK